MTFHFPDHQDCQRCKWNLWFIQRCHSFIDKAATQGMRRSGERVAVFLEVWKGTLGFHSIPIKRLVEIEDDEELKSAYQKTSESLNPGEILVIAAFANEEHFGIYKLLPGPLN